MFLVRAQALKVNIFYVGLQTIYLKNYNLNIEKTMVQ